ncbi:TonB-dependent receptor [Aureispira anguillae]|uniref:TonB-dependent receptor n=1 Tax=Aureispira anguillae TaxID=2864201 RepID=A0A916DX43_9BACT|nr:TonB-dependent receptor [Aureispira anguillae]BDS14681.1 TonB-dependent receptor [Aureispira anguillae]
MKQLLVLSLIIFLAQISYGQTLLSGLVTDRETGEPLIGVTISQKGTTAGTTTDINGNYQLKLEKGKHLIVFRYVGFKPLEQEIVSDGETEMVFDIALWEDVLEGETIIVTDGKYEKKLEESTVSIDVIGSQQLENNNITSLDEIVQKTSGVQITDGQISIRGGAGYAYGVGSRVIFLVDGQALLSAELSDVKWNFMPVENTEQIEIIKGAASVLYGSAALNGVVNLRTAYPKGNKPYTAISMYAGIYDQPRIDSMRWFKPKDGMAEMPMFAGLYFAHRQKPHKNVDLVIGGNVHLKNGYYKGADERRFRFNFNTRIRVPKSEGRLSYGLNGNLMYHEDGRFFMAEDMTNNAYINLTEINRDRYYSITLDPYFTAFDQSDNKHDVRARWFRISKVQTDEDSEADLVSLEYQFQRNFANQWIVTAGAVGQYMHVNSILFADINTHWSERALFTASSVGAYAQVDKKFWNRLSTTLGLRWEGFLVDSIFTPTLPILRAGVNFEASPNDFIRASFGQGFRFPSMAERYFNEKIPGTFWGIYPNPDLLPEVGWSTEIAYRHTFVGKNFKIYADLAFFWMEYENMVEFALGVHPQGPGFSFVNISKARLAGWELSTQGVFQLGKIPLRIWGGYTYSFPGDLSSDTSRLRNLGTFVGKVFTTFVDGVQRNDLDDILKYRRLHTVRLDLETELWGITLGTALNYNSFMDKIDALFEFNLITKGVSSFRAIHNKGYWLWDLRIGYKFNDKQRINLVVQNVLNEEYANRPAQMGAPRSFSLKYSQVF